MLCSKLFSLHCFLGNSLLLPQKWHAELTHSCLCIAVNFLKHRHILWKLKTLDVSYEKFHLGSRKQYLIYLISRNWNTSLRFRLFILVCFDIQNKYGNRRVSSGETSRILFSVLQYNTAWGASLFGGGGAWFIGFFWGVLFGVFFICYMYFCAWWICVSCKMNFQTIIHILVPKHCFLPLSKQVHHVSVMQGKNSYLLEDQVDQVSHCHPSDQQDPIEQWKKGSVDHAAQHWKITHTKAKGKSRKHKGELLTLDPLEPLGPWGPYGQEEHITLVGVYCTQLWEWLEQEGWMKLLTGNPGGPGGPSGPAGPEIP